MRVAQPVPTYPNTRSAGPAHYVAPLTLMSSNITTELLQADLGEENRENISLFLFLDISYRTLGNPALELVPTRLRSPHQVQDVPHVVLSAESQKFCEINNIDIFYFTDLAMFSRNRPS